MFNSCKKLSYIDLSGFNTSKVTNMQSMFYNCEKLENIDLSNFDSSNVTNMSYMFDRCSNLTSLDVSTFDTSKVTNMNAMFAYCNVLETIYVSNKWNMSSVTASSNMFMNCKSLTGAVPFDSTKTDVSMANYTTGYLTYKKNTN